MFELQYLKCGLGSELTCYAVTTYSAVTTPDGPDNMDKYEKTNFKLTLFRNKAKVRVVIIEILYSKLVSQPMTCWKDE